MREKGSRNEGMELLVKTHFQRFLRGVAALQLFISMMSNTRFGASWHKRKSPRRGRIHARVSFVVIWPEYSMLAREHQPPREGLEKA